MGMLSVGAKPQDIYYEKKHTTLEIIPPVEAHMLLAQGKQIPKGFFDPPTDEAQETE